MNIKKILYVLTIALLGNIANCYQEVCPPCNCKTTYSPTTSPTISPTWSPTISPTTSPSSNPSESPTWSPTYSPTTSPSSSPSSSPTLSPTTSPSESPTRSPTNSPSVSPSSSPTRFPSVSPTTSPFVCVKPLDVGIVMDRSGSIFPGGLVKQKNFATNLVGRFTLGEDGAMFSVISFSSSVDGIIGFSDNSVSITDAIDSVASPKGSTFTGGAIKYFSDNYLPTSRRFNKFLVLITDGKPTKSGQRGMNPEQYAKYEVQ